MRDTVVNDWIEFEKLAFEKCWDEKTKRYRSNYVFRGVCSREFSLMPGLNRTCGKNLQLEKSLIRNFKKYASQEIKFQTNFWDIISMAQHHGMPTRLLDWTFSPYVAAHFATEDFGYYDTDGAIWCVDFVKCNEHLPAALRDVLDKEDAYGFSTEMLGDTIKDFCAMKDFEKDIENQSYPLFFEPPAIDGRIVNQYALFSVMSDSEILLSDWLIPYSDYYYRIIIPAKVKLEIRDKLDQINITERIIYPGLDGLCKWLTRHYKDTPSIYDT